MKSILDQINMTPGVVGSALFGRGGRCLADGFSPPYSAILWTEVLKDLETVATTFSAIDAGPIEATVAVFEQGTVVARNIRDLTLCVLAGPEANLAMLGVALKVSMLRLKQGPVETSAASPAAWESAAVASNTSRPAAAEASSRGPPGAEGVGTGRSPRAQSVGVSVGASAAAAGSSLSHPFVSQPFAGHGSIGESLSWGSREEWSRHHHAHAAGRSAMHHVLRTFARYAGPQAKFILEDEIERLNATPMTLPSQLLGTLIEAASQRITPKSQRKKFIAEALGDR